MVWVIAYASRKILKFGIAAMFNRSPLLLLISEFDVLLDERDLFGVEACWQQQDL
jgi:hypothetical protein